ncbi:MAG: hypothetical protein R3Y28_06870 [Candidatus Gastranaerophilales bacterium]
MADIYTHLRELGVAFSFFNKNNIEEISPVYFLQICNKHIKSGTTINISQIAENTLSFTGRELETIKNAIKLGDAIKEQFKISDNPKIAWLGNDTQSDSPVDLIIDEYKFSLKEESFILENMGLYKLLNILLDDEIYTKGVHVFKEFAKEEFDNWLRVTCKLLVDSDESFAIEKHGKYEAGGNIESGNIMLAYNEQKICLDDPLNINCEKFENITNAKIREYAFSKWLKVNIESNPEYVAAKKHCAEQAGLNLLELVKPSEESSPKMLKRFFRIEQDEYYYAKTTSKEIKIYKVPSALEAEQNIKIKEVSTAVPKSQLNFYTEIENIKTNKSITFRNELRYSHGQFNGTPEAKCYISEGDLTAMYERVL